MYSTAFKLTITVKTTVIVPNYTGTKHDLVKPSKSSKNTNKDNTRQKYWRQKRNQVCHLLDECFLLCQITAKSCTS